jgi:hypothetical protein
MTKRSTHHPTTDELELLALGRMAPAMESTMAHIDGCARCTKNFQKTKQYVAAMQVALRKLQGPSRKFPRQNYPTTG